MKLQFNYSLKNKNTFGIESTAEVYLNVKKVWNLIRPNYSTYHHQLILGGGSNIVLPERFDGIVFRVNITGAKIVKETANYRIVRVGAGASWHKFVESLIEAGVYGLENLALIPGRVGAAPIQNIGAYGIEQEKYFYSAEIVDLAKRRRFFMDKEEFSFGYRNSFFKQEMKSGYVITHIHYKFPLKWEPNTEYKDIRDAIANTENFELTPKNIFNLVCDIRNKKLPNPKETGNAGSFFKNPIVSKEFYQKLIQTYPDLTGYPDKDGMKISAAKIIEKAGWKGRKLNENSQAGISEKHSLVIINLGNATYSDIFELSEAVINDIYQKSGIRLEREVNMIS